MNKKVKKILLGVWGLLLYVSTAWGFSELLETINIPISFSIGLGNLFSISSLIALIYLFEKEDEKK